VREDKAIGQIAGAQIVNTDLGTLRDDGDDTPDWLDLQIQANTALRETIPQHFRQRLERLTRKLNRYISRNPDGTLFALIYLSATELRLYSATHAMLTMVMCTLAAREVLNWPEHEIELLANAALTMNLGMTDLQDRLASRTSRPTPASAARLTSMPTARPTCCGNSALPSRCGWKPCASTTPGYPARWPAAWTATGWRGWCSAPTCSRPGWRRAARACPRHRPPPCRPATLTKNARLTKPAPR